MNKFYVYVLLDPRKPGKFEYSDFCFLYEPFYIGKGSGRRINRHLCDDKKELSRNFFKTNIINKINKELGLKPFILKLKINLTEKEAFDLEKKLIQEIGRRDKKLGTLTNLTNGGEGSSGYTHSEESKLKIGISSKGRIPYIKGKKHTEETKNKISKSNKGKNLTIEQIDFLKESRKGCGNPMFGKKQSIETRNKRKTSMIGKNSKRILQYDIYGNFLKEWISASEASKELNIQSSTISASCRGERAQSGGFLWFFKENDFKQNIVVNNKKFDYKRTVIQKSLNGEVIKEWKNAKEVSLSLNFTAWLIIECCRKNKTSYKNFLWCFL